MSFFIY